MALYACDDDDLIFAPEAKRGKTYWCLECFCPVKVRRGKDRFAHFYHLQSSPRCRLYSKSEDHLRAQIQLQKLFPAEALQIERPFVDINRVADLCWEKGKIVFEIQCSPLDPKEAEARIRDYKLMGYEAVWLLDDRRYNRRVLRPAEEFLRQQACYYVDIKPGLTSDYYDQFEIFGRGKRLKKGRKLAVDLQRLSVLSGSYKDFQHLPRQVQIQLANRNNYFFGDRISRAIQAERNPFFALAMENWRALEKQFEILLSQENRKPSIWKQWLRLHFGRPYLTVLDKLLRKVSS